MYFARSSNTATGKIQSSLDAKRDTNIGIALCIKGSLHSRWSIEMT